MITTPGIEGFMRCINHISRFRTAGRLSVRTLTMVMVLSVLTFPAMAQDAQLDTGKAASKESAPATEVTPLEGIIVTALKREAMIQDVPVSMTAFDSEQLDALKLRDIGDLTITMPNVALDDVGVTRGIANFSIRGLGINSSIPSIDPTVGVFVDGIYLGTNTGVLYDAFDLDSIEVLRGPQGVLFGRNVVGGAVLVNTKTPTDHYEATVRSAIEGGGKAPNIYVSGTFNAPLTDTLRARFTVYSNQDQGWFENEYNGKAFGARNTLMLRPVVTWQPWNTLRFTLRYEYQDLDEDGPAVQTHTNGAGLSYPLFNFRRDSHDFAINEEGFQKTVVHFFNTRADWDIPFGNGTITNIFGWREGVGDGLSDADATPLTFFHGGGAQASEQFSNELRYSGMFFDRLFLTTGFYYFQNDLSYHEQRLFGDPSGDILEFNGGGIYNVETFGLFMNGDYDLTDRLTLTLGLRYTHEEKAAEIANILRNVDVSCHIVTGPDCPTHFKDSASWNSLSPKVGLTYRLDAETLLYAHWTRGFRSGGYNLRDSFFDLTQGLSDVEIAGLEALGLEVARDLGTEGFDEEQIDNFEIGVKRTWGDRVRLNASFFYNFVDGLQRELAFGEDLPAPDPVTGRPVITFVDGRPTIQTVQNIVQVIRNTADAEFWGLEMEGMMVLSPGLVFLGSLGYVEPDYTKVKFDLNRDGKLDSKDEALEPPRAAHWTYSLGLLHDLRVGTRARLASRVIYAYRDKEYTNDDNTGFNRQQKMLQAGMDIRLDNSQWVVGLYGKNLLDYARFGTDIQLPTGTFSPLMRGRVFGLELTYHFTDS